MAQLQYRSKTRPVESAGRPATDVMIPTAMLLIGFGLYGFLSYKSATPRYGIGLELGFLGVILGIQTVLGMAAAFITAKILSTSFGEFWPALLKLAAIILFTGVLSLVIPYGGLLVLFIYLGLLMWLFDLEFGESIVFAVVFTIIRFGVVIALYGMRNM